MRDLKYIRTAFDDFLLFPVWLGHNEAAAGIKIKNPEVSIESAGFVKFFDGTLEAGGGSTSLRIDSRADDTAALKKFLGIYD